MFFVMQKQHFCLGHRFQLASGKQPITKKLVIDKCHRQYTNYIFEWQKQLLGVKQGSKIPFF